MIRLPKKFMLIFGPFLCMTTVQGYEFHFQNFTDKTLIIATKKRAGITDKYYQIVKPEESVIQVWDDANCLESLEWTELNPRLPLHGGLDLISPLNGNQIPRDKQETFRRTFTNLRDKGKGLYLWNELKIIFVPNEIFRKTREAATKLVKGIDQGICQSIDTLAAGTVKKITLAASKNKKDCFMNLAAIADAAGKITGESICKSRNFIVYWTGKEDWLTGMPEIIAETTEGE